MAQITLVEAVNLALARAMRDEPDVIVLGEDVGRDGGVFRATLNLLEEFGSDRLLDGVPIFIQGDRAYCGVATLAMRSCPLTVLVEAAQVLTTADQSTALRSTSSMAMTVVLAAAALLKRTLVLPGSVDPS